MVSVCVHGECWYWYYPRSSTLCSNTDRFIRRIRLSVFSQMNSNTLLQRNLSASEFSIFSIVSRISRCSRWTQESGRGPFILLPGTYEMHLVYASDSDTSAQSMLRRIGKASAVISTCKTTIKPSRLTHWKTSTRRITQESIVITLWK